MLRVTQDQRDIVIAPALSVLAKVEGRSGASEDCATARFHAVALHGPLDDPTTLVVQLGAGVIELALPGSEQIAYVTRWSQIGRDKL